MESETRKDIAEKLGALLQTEENVDLLARFFLPVFNYDDTDIGKNFLSLYNDIPTKEMPNDYIAEEFKATRNMMLKVLNSCSDLKKAQKGEFKEKAPAKKKTYK